MTRLTSKAIEGLIRKFHKIPDDSNPCIIGIHPKDVFIGLSNWGNAKCVFTKQLIQALENVFGLHLEYIEPAEETVVMAKFSR